nr:hypothetical protein [Cyclobacteriaceae bacterium]
MIQFAQTTKLRMPGFTLITSLIIFCFMFTNPVSAQDIIGRWDLTVDMNGKPVPSWLEVKKSG